MDPSSLITKDSSTKTTTPNSNGGMSSVRNSTLNSFLWYFFQAQTVSCFLLMVLSIYFAFASSEGVNTRVICVISTVAFAIISPSFIIPKLPQIAAAAIPIVVLNKNLTVRLLNLVVWVVCGCPFLIYLSCSYLMAGVGLYKLYGDGGPAFRRVMYCCGCFTVFAVYVSYRGGIWSWMGFVCTVFHGIDCRCRSLPSLMEPEKKKMNATAAVSIQYEKKKKMNVTEAAIPGTKTLVVVFGSKSRSHQC